MLYVPAEGPEDWKRLLAKPDAHWATGFSAKTLAHCWSAANGEFPPCVRAALDTNEALRSADLLAGFVEHRGHLPPDKRWPTHNDILAFARTRHGQLASITVEGKVDEPFDKTVKDWRSDSPSDTREERLKLLCELLSVKPEEVLPLRYQLLHRTASALIEGRRWNAAHSVMLVHSFGSPGPSFDDFAAFGRLLGVTARPGQVASVGQRGATQVLHIGWVEGDRKFLTA